MTSFTIWVWMNRWLNAVPRTLCGFLHMRFPFMCVNISNNLLPSHFTTFHVILYMKRERERWLFIRYMRSYNIELQFSCQPWMMKIRKFNFSFFIHEIVNFPEQIKFPLHFFNFVLKENFIKAFFFKKLWEEKAKVDHLLEISWTLKLLWTFFYNLIQVTKNSAIL